MGNEGSLKYQSLALNPPCVYISSYMKSLKPYLVLKPPLKNDLLKNLKIWYYYLYLNVARYMLWIKYLQRPMTGI